MNLYAGKYEELEPLGQGAYSSVVSARDVSTGNRVAIKHVTFHSQTEGVPTTTIREVAILRTLQHPNIIALREVIHGSDVDGSERICLVLEFMQYHLTQYLTEKSYSDEACNSCLRQLLQAVAHVHASKVMHRDLKPANILVHTDGTLKLCDFGLAREFGIPTGVRTMEVVTLWWRAPEILLGWRSYTFQSDIWSVGCIMAEIWGRRTLFMGDSEIDQLTKIFSVLGTPNEEVWPGWSSLPYHRTNFPDWTPQPLETVVPQLGACGCDLLQSLLKFDPQQRGDAKDCLRHPFIQDFHPAAALST